MNLTTKSTELIFHLVEPLQSNFVEINWLFRIFFVIQQWHTECLTSYKQWIQSMALNSMFCVPLLWTLNKVHWNVFLHSFYDSPFGLLSIAIALWWSLKSVTTKFVARIKRTIGSNLVEKNVDECGVHLRRAFMHACMHVAYLS